MDMRIALLAVLLVGTTRGAHIYSRSPYWMGTGGGITLYIGGRGFSEDQFNQFDPTLGNQVVLVNEKDSIPCDVINYLTNTERIACVTGRRTNSGAPTVYQIKVFVDGKEASGYAVVQFTGWVSPKIQSVEPRWSLPGALVKYSGWFHTNTYQRIDTEDPTEKDPNRGRVLTKVYMGGVNCEMVNSTSDELWAPLTSSQLTCRVTSKYIGPMNGTVYVTERGASVTDRYMMYVDSKDRLFQHHTYAGVEGVSPAVSSTGGGALITVTGQGFDPHPGTTQVRVGGAVCELQQVTDETITCLAPPQVNTAPGSGERGLLFELWEGVIFDNLGNTELWQNLTSSHPNYTAYVTLETLFDIPLESPSTGRFRGYIHAPHDGTYAIGAELGSASLLYIATNGNPNDKVINHWAEFTMMADTPAYLEILFHARGTTRLRLMMKDLDAKFVSRQTFLASNERQQVKIYPRVVWETQRFTLEGDPGKAKLFLNGISSVEVNISDPMQVREQLLTLTDQLCQVLGDDPNFALNISYEVGEEEPLGSQGTTVDDVVPFCGRRVKRVRRTLPQLYYQGDREKMVNVNDYPYACLALRGNIESTMDVRFYWWDKWNRYRDDIITFTHNFTSTSTGWTYQCLDLRNVVAGSWMKDQYLSGELLLLKHFKTPKPASIFEEVYCDEFALVDQIINVEQTRPSALKSAGILIADVQVASVKEEGTNAFDVSFITSNCAGDFPLLGVFTGNVNMSWVEELRDASGANFSVNEGQVEVRRVQMATHPVTGSWDLLIQGKTVSGIPPSVHDQELRLMIENGLGRTGVEVTRSGSCDKRSWYLEWTEDPGRKEIVDVDISGLVFDGDDISVHTRRSSEARIWHDTLSVDFLTAWREEPHVVVTVNGYTAACLGDCSFTYDDTDAPSLSSVTGSGDETGVHTVTVTGTGFTSTNKSDYVVTVGDKDCSVTDVTTTQVTCNVSLWAGNYLVTVAMQPVGAALPYPSQLTFDVPLTLTSVTPTTGGTGGGYSLEVSGTGFPDPSGWAANSSVTLGGFECEVTGAGNTGATTSVICDVPPSAAGTVDVTVTVGAVSATLVGGFTFDASLSASVTSVSPTTTSVLGGEMTISGSGFGSGADGYVKVGSAACETVTWDDLTIVCSLPALPPGQYPVLVHTGAQGSASGNALVTYNLKITASSLGKGSVSGGTILVLQGVGFGSNCSLLEVDLGGGMRCEVTECSDTRVTCRTQFDPVNHVLTNLGTHSTFGVGYAWKPRLATVLEGDSVTWFWSKKDPFSQLKHNVFQTATSASFLYDGSGFHSGAPTSTGSMTVRFPKSGTYYFSGDPVDKELFMSGQIIVLKPGQASYKVTLTLAGMEAEYDPSGDGVDVTIDGCDPVLEDPLADCNSTAPSPPDADHAYFITDTCFTPVVTSITVGVTEDVLGLSGLQVRAGTTLTIAGSGFGSSPCQTSVRVGPASCSVTASADDAVTCVLDDLENLLSIWPYPVSVSVANRGNALTEIPDFKVNGQVTVVPVMTSFDPAAGSLAGGTLITITGTGLKAFNGQATVKLGSETCQVVSVTPTNITCLTSPTSPSNVTLALFVGGVEAVNEVSDSIFRFSEAATPTVSSIIISGETVSINGSAFGSDSSKITVTFTPTSARRKRSVEEEVARLEEEEEGTTAVMEDEEVDDEIGVYDEEAEEPRSMHHPQVHSDLFDNFDAVSDFWGHFTRTNAKTFIGTKSLGAWRVGGTNPTSVSFEGLEETHRVKREAEDAPESFVCVVSSTSDTSIVCEATGLPAGAYVVIINVESLGDAVANEGVNMVTAAAAITDMTPTEGSVNGGALLTISGSGFIPGEVSVTLDGVECQLVSENATTLTCRTPAHAAGTVTVVVTAGGTSTNSPSDFTYDLTKTPVLTSVSPATGVTVGMTLTLSGSDLRLSGSDPEVLLGGTPCPVDTASDTELTCTSPDLVAGTYGLVVRDLTYGDSSNFSVTYDLTLTSLSPSTGGFGGAEVTINGAGFDPTGGSTVTFCGDLCSPVDSTSSSSLVCVAPAMAQGEGSTLLCDVVVSNPDGSNVTLAGGFTYDASITASVASVSPARGGTAGGTTLTITGSGFAASGNTVKIGGSECVVTAESTTEITCTTEAHQGPGSFPVLVTVPAAGIATTDGNGVFFYIDRWSSPYTWGGEPVPSEGQLVVIEEGQTILIDESTDVLKMLLIKGGHVVVDQDAPDEIVLRAEYILIVGGGSLSIGSEEEPYRGKAVIELHGNSRSIELPNYGAKVLAVRNGTLDLHGAHVPITWTHLASTASPGDTSITLKLPVTWQPGDQVVIATTERRFKENENEVRTIASVSGDGLTLTLTEALQHEHLSLQQTLGGRTVETRAEVGLLTRNVRVRGAVNSAFTETIEACDETWKPGQFATQSCFNGRFGEEIGSDQFGATVMLSGKNPDEDLVRGRIQYVEVTEAGQAFQLGRYPLHFHLVGNVNTSYIRGCAVHRTYNRAVTIHAANYLTVEHNVVYDNMGHAIFTEDGVEQYNVIQYNLAVYTRTSSSLLNVDVTPSSFWVVNPNNIVRHNAAAGGTHFGYWYRIERHPSGPSFDSSYCQNNAPMGEFRNNTAHSMGRYGLWVFSMDGYHPKTGNCGGRDQVAAWNDFTVWRCDRGAEIVLGGALQFHNFVALDNQHAGLEMVKVKGGFGEDDGPGIFDSLVVGHSALTPGGCDSGSGIVAPKQYVFSIANTTFLNFDHGECSALSGCSQCKPFQGGYRVQVMGLTFINAPNKLKFKWEHETIWIDADGSLTGLAENNVVPSMGILPTDTCQKDVPAFSVNPQAPGAVCSSALTFLRFNVKGPDIEPSSLKGNDLIVTSPHGSTNVPYRVKRLTTEGWMGILYSGGTFNWTFDYSSHITNISYTAETRFVDHGDYYFVQHEMMQRPDGISTTGDDRNSTDSVPDPTTNVHGDYHWDNDTRIVTYLVSNILSNTRRRRSVVFDDRNIGSDRTIDFRVHRCQYDGCVPPTPPPVPTGQPNTTFRWSDVETWKEVPVGSGGHPSEDVYNLPVEGDEIIIPQGMWLIVDTETPPLARVYVYGGLEFEDTMDHVFNTTIIYIQGGTVVAGFSEDAPFTHNLNIVLRGSLDPDDPDNQDMPLPYGVPNVGWKAIGVFGQLTLHGQLSGRSWVKLGVTASSGDSQVTLAQAADPSWLNKQVMVTTSGKEATETELRTVTAVDGAVLTLDAPLLHQHLGETHTLSDGATVVSLAAEVGLLTRNIVVQGNDYPALEDDSFGGRIIVSQLTDDGVTYVGRAQLHSVELRNMGQIGFTDTDDPRYSLAFHELGVVDGSNYVKKCSFNKNYNVALGFFGSNNITVESNVIYHTVGSCIRDDSEDNTFRDNLLSVMLFPGFYNGRQEDQNLDWFGGFDLNKASGTVLEDNVVAGSEQAGFRTYGELCDVATRWSNNEVHSATYGVLLWKKGGGGPPDECRRLNSFSAWRVWDTAFYMQHYASFLLTDVTAVDCKLGVNQLVYSPPALSHESYPKTATVQNSVFVGASPSHTCSYHNSKSSFQDTYRDVFWKGGLDDGNTGIIFASFTSSVNMAPKHKFNEASSYPALYGSSHITGVTFANFASRSCGRDQALLTNRESDDGIHPIFVSGLVFLDTPEANYLFLHRASLDRVNPSDCVDMDCDGLKKVLVQDMDGSLLGSVNATVISEAEHQWDGDRSHGVGDYRIPVPLKQNLDGSQIPAQDKFPNKGIVRDDSCSLVPTWQAWKCTNLQHRMLVIESLDSDTEIRRLSPIALIANPGTTGYVDLLNGPMDRGWCMGYTCQERISTFYSVVAAGYVYEMAMTSTPPQHLRLHLLHSDPSEAVVVRLFFPKTQRYDVYVDDSFLPPNNIDNTQYPSKYQLIPEDPANPEAFFPTLSQGAGSNYLQRTEKFLHVVVRGGHVVDIKTTPLIVLNFGLVVDPDNIYEENIVQNMAGLLGVSPENIRVTNIVREDSRRRRRRSATETVQVEFEVAGVPTATAADNSTAQEGVDGDVLSYDDLVGKFRNFINNYQTDGCSGCNVSIASVRVIDPVEPPKVPDGPATEEFGSQIIEGGELYSDVQQQQEQEALNKSLDSTSYDQPAYSTLEQGVPAVVTAYTLFASQPSITVQDSNGSTIAALGHTSDPWMVTAVLSGGPAGASLLGTNPVPYLEGAANFTDLLVDKPGAGYNLTFSVTHPDTAPRLAVTLDASFRAREKNLSLSLSVMSEFLLANRNFSLGLDLLDLDTGEPVDQSQMLGQTMQGALELVTHCRTGNIFGNTKFTVADGNVSSFTIDELTIDQLGAAFQIKAFASILPGGWILNGLTDELVVYPADLVVPEEPISLQVRILIRSNRKWPLSSQSAFENFLLETLLLDVGKAFWGKVSLLSQRKAAFTVSLDVRGSREQLDEAVNDLCRKIKSRKLRMTLNGRSFTLKRLWINGRRLRRCNYRLTPRRLLLQVKQLVNPWRRPV